MKNIKNKIKKLNQNQKVAKGGACWIKSRGSLWLIGLGASISAGELPQKMPEATQPSGTNTQYGFPTEQVSANYFPSKEDKKRESVKYPVWNQEAILNENKYIIERGFK